MSQFTPKSVISRVPGCTAGTPARAAPLACPSQLSTDRSNITARFKSGLLVSFGKKKKKIDAQTARDVGLVILLIYIFVIKCKLELGELGTGKSNMQRIDLVEPRLKCPINT